ncbi:MAG: translation elongation factor Ts [Candidatus Aureabacteria bacterium]|nr:translation elongation factor Ts [Candidatus Auribacterota bacterium]
MTVTAEMVRELRDKTNAGIMDCKVALAETKGDLQKAIDFLRKRGLAIAAKKAGRTAAEGIIGSYIHHGDKIGVMVEVNCETDFVARNSEFREFVKMVTLQIASAAPAYLKSEEVPQDVLDREKDIFRAQIKGKPANVIEKIVEGKLSKFYESCCLLEQPSVRPEHEGRKIKDLLTDLIAKLGENIVIKRFTRYQLGA